jgi:hypothetical protein
MNYLHIQSKIGYIHMTYLCFTEIAAAGCFLDTRLQKRVFVETKSTEIILMGSCLFVWRLQRKEAEETYLA